MNAHQKIAKALDRMNEIMAEPSVTEMRGLAYTDDEVELLKRAWDSARFIEDAPKSFATLIMNGKHLDEAVKGVEKAHFMLDRVGFRDVKGVAWVERDQRIVDEGYEAALQLTGKSRA